MHPNLAVILSVCCYAIAAVILDQKLRAFNGSLMVAGLGGTICVMGLINYALTRAPNVAVNFPHGVLLLWLLGAYIVWYFGDRLYVHAYNSEGSLYTVTILGMMFVPIAAMLRFTLTHEWPTRYHVIAYVLGCVMVILTIYGNQQNE